MAAPKGKIDWTENVALRQAVIDLWPTMSASQIAEKLGLSKGSVVGFVHRFKLPQKTLSRPWARGPQSGQYERRLAMIASGEVPSPVPRKGREKKRREKKMATKTVEVEKSITSILLAPLEGPTAATSILIAPAPPIPLRRYDGCQWPLGDPKDKDFRFCSAWRMSGRPYCPRHWALAHSGAKAVI